MVACLLACLLACSLTQPVSRLSAGRPRPSSARALCASRPRACAVGARALQTRAPTAGRHLARAEGPSVMLMKAPVAAASWRLRRPRGRWSTLELMQIKSLARAGPSAPLAIVGCAFVLLVVVWAAINWPLNLVAKDEVV